MEKQWLSTRQQLESFRPNNNKKVAKLNNKNQMNSIIINNIESRPYESELSHNLKKWETVMK